MKILAFAASNSPTSINNVVVRVAADLLKEHFLPEADIEILDLSEFEMPLYRPDREENDGVPAKAKLFRDKIGEADALLVSFAEHNGNYTAAFKNLFDWASRMGKDVYQGKPAVVFSASPGKGGAASVMKLASESAGFFGMEILAKHSIPSFYDHFDAETVTVTDSDLEAKMKDMVGALAKV